MSKCIFLIRDIADIERLDSVDEFILFSDSPSAREKIKDMGYEVHGTAHYTHSEFWHDIISSREAVLAGVDVHALLKAFSLQEEMTDSLMYHLRYTLIAVVYEAKLAALLSQEFNSAQVRFGREFVSYLIQNGIEGCSGAQTSDVLRESSAIKTHIVNFLSHVMFKASLLRVRFSFKKGILATAPGSGLANVVDSIHLNTEDNIKTVYLQAASVAGSFSNKVYKKLQASFFLANRMDIAAFPPLSPYRSKLKISEVLFHRCSELLVDCYNPKSVERADLLTTGNVAQWLMSVLCDWGAKCMRNIDVTRHVVKAMKPSMIIAQYSLDMAVCLGLSARQYNVPSLLVTHGSHVVNSDPVANIEWRRHSKTLFDGPFDFTAIQTPAAQQFYDSDRAQPSPLYTGGLIVNGLQEPSDPQKRKELFGRASERQIILHAGTPKLTYGIRPLIYETVDEYLENIKSFVEAVSLVPNAYAAIRLQTQWGITQEVVERVLPQSDHWGIYIGGRFDDYLAQSDVLVSYSSTTIEQALFAGKPVILWNSTVPYNHFSAAALNSGEGQPKGIWLSNKDTIEKDLSEIANWDTEYADSDTVQSLYRDFAEQTSEVRRNLFDSVAGALK